MKPVLTTPRTRWHEEVNRFKNLDEPYEYWGERAKEEFRAVKKYGMEPPDGTEEKFPNTATVCCHACDEQVAVAVYVGEEPDYESATARLCEKCLREALAVITRGRLSEDEQRKRRPLPPEVLAGGEPEEEVVIEGRGRAVKTGRKVSVLHNCWTCGNDTSEHLCRLVEEDMDMDEGPEEIIRWLDLWNFGDRMPPKDYDVPCPGWAEK